MLLKHSQTEKRTRPNASSKQQRASGAMKLTVGIPTPRVGRKVMKGVATKRTAHGQQRLITARTEERTTVDPCDNSNDSGLGFDHLDFQLAARSTQSLADQEAAYANEHFEIKRKKLEIKLESDNANDDFGFPETMNRRERKEVSHRITARIGTHLENAQTTGIGMIRSSQPRPQAIGNRRTAIVPVTSQSAGAVTSRNGKTQLQIVCQPETQHRARYQTEGSRGAVKDRSGNGFPVVKLTNYDKPATLEVFIGTDVGRVQPHMFYQACRVSGKNSTPCVEKKIDGTVVIEVDFDPAKDYVITCDCVGILKERNVDVEHRFPNEQQTRNKKKSTRCRMVFRTKIVHADDTEEWLQITSHPIVCTQPPGVPEICKKSLSASPCTGGLELFILGKNFLKDTRVLFQQTDAETPWEESVQPDKEFLQQTHLVCVVPPYRRTDITESVTVRLAISSSGKTSEPHNFTYTPAIQQPAVVPEGTQPCVTLVQSTTPHTGGDIPHAFPRSSLVASGGGMMLADVPSNRTTKTSPKKNQYIPIDAAPSTSSIVDADPHHLMMWQTPLMSSAEASKIESKMVTEQKELDRVMSGKIMPPPPPPLLPIGRRRASTNVHLINPDSDSSSLKTELVEDGNSQSSEDVKGIDLRLKPVATVNPLGSASDLSNTQAPTLATLQRFVTGSGGTPLPTQSATSIEKYLSNLENVSNPGGVKAPIECLVPPCKIENTVTQPLLAQQQTVANVSVPLMFSTQNTAECKPRFSSEDEPLLQQVRRKSAYEESLNINSSSDTVVGRRQMVVLQESQNRNPLVSSLSETVSSMMDSVTSNPSLMMYASGERTVRQDEKPQHISTLVSESDKLDALVNSAAVSHMIPSPSSTDQTSPIPVKKMSLDPPSYSLMPTCNQLLSSTNIDASTASSSSPNVMFTSHDRTSPIAVKNIISSSPEGQIILTSATQNSPGSGSMMDTLQSHGQILSTSATSPIAVKKMMETHCENQMLSANSTSTNAGQTSPIAIRSIMEQAGVSVNPDTCLTNPPIAIKTILNSEVGETLLPATTVAAPSQVSSSESIGLNTLIQQENVLTTGAQVTSAENSNLSILVQSTLTSHPQQNPILASGTQSVSNSTDGLVQSTLNNQPRVILASSASVESARLNVLAQSALNNQNQTSILITGESAGLNSLTQSILNNQTQQQSVLVSNTQLSEESSRLDSYAQPLMNSSSQQSAIMASSAQVSLTQSLMNNPSPPTSTQLILNNQIQQQTVGASEDNVRLNSLTQTLLNSQSQQQTVLGTGVQASEDSTRLSSLAQTIQQAVLPASVQITENTTALNSLTQSMINSQSSDTVLVTSAAMCEHSAKLRSYAQSLMNNQNQQQALIAADSATLNALVQPSLASHRHQDTAPQTCIPTIVTQASQPLAVPPVTESEALLNRIFATNQNPTVNTPTTVIVGSGNLLEGTQFTTAASESSLMTRCTVTNKQPAAPENSSGFMTHMILGLAANEKIKKDTEMSIATGDKNVTSSSVHQKQEKVLQTEGARVVQTQPTPQKKGEEGMVPQELAQMSENDLLSYINPSTFDQGF